MQVKVEVEARRRQAEILTRVVSHGLLSARDQREGGHEPFHSKTSTSVVVYGCLIQPSSLWEAACRVVSGKTTGDQVKEALYRDAWSVFPVIAERGNQDCYPVFKISDGELEERFRRSAVAIIPVTPEVKLIITEENYFVDQQGKKRVVGRKYGLKSPVPVDLIDTFLVPAILDKELAAELPPTQISLVQVDQREERLFWRREDRILRVPDYETGVRQQLAWHKKPLFIHGIRLPTDDDISSS